MWLYLAAVLAGLYLLRRWHRERQMEPGLSEKYVLITGCDSGFGNLLARQLDARGLRVLAACLTDTGAAQLRAATSSRLQTVLLDVTSSQSIAAAAAWVQERVGDQGLWGLVNNAGTTIPSAPNEWLTKDDFVKVLDVNLVGLIEVTLSLLPLVRRAQGRVVNVSSVMGRSSFFGGGYCISKYGVEAHSALLHTHSFGVQVPIIKPGGFWTGMIDPTTVVKDFRYLWEQLPVEIQANYSHHYLETCEYVSLWPQQSLVAPAPSACRAGVTPSAHPVAKSSVLLHCLSSSHPSHVAGVAAHTLLARFPRSYDAAGWDARLALLPLSY
ncbi:RDH16 dehydrogenase, partial [Anhinga anhinga]|nr:RDH16 dehydrogenase [Anhinga anhinga]